MSAAPTVGRERNRCEPHPLGESRPLTDAICQRGRRASRNVPITPNSARPTSTSCFRNIAGSDETAQHIAELARSCEDRQMASPLEQIEPRPRNMRGEIAGGLKGDATIMRPMRDKRWDLDVLQYRSGIGRLIWGEETLDRLLRQTQTALEELLP